MESKCIQSPGIADTNLVDVVVEQLINEVNMGQKHSSATVSTESQLIQYLSHIYILSSLSVFVSFPYHHAELFPFVSDYLAATEATHWNDHVEVM